MRREGPVPSRPRVRGGHILAAILFHLLPMARPSAKPIPLRETPSAAPFGAQVIDVDFTVVAEGRAQRSAKPKPTLMKKIKGWATAIALATLVGVMIPPTVLLVRALLG